MAFFNDVHASGYNSARSVRYSEAMTRYTSPDTMVRDGDESRPMSYNRATVTILLLGEEASPSIGNTLWRVSTMFTRSAITPPEVNGFG